MAQQHKIGKHATTVATSDGFTRVTYHQTAVVRFNGAKIILNSEGWQTVTTKTRMNQASSAFDLRYHVYQRNFEWFVNFKGKELEFVDNMVLDR